MSKYIGTARSLHDWSSLDTQFWIALGTECKLYVVNNQNLYDITPTRKSSNVIDVFTTLIGNTTVTVTDIDHRANDGDHMRVIGSAVVGGILISGTYDIVSVVDPDNYTIVVRDTPTSSETSGGSVTLQYDISCGLAENGELLGYGTGLFGEGTFGTPRVAGTGVPAKLRAWSLQSWGEDLVASYNDGELYWWDRTTGTSSAAKLIITAPTNIQHMLVDNQYRRIMLFGCTDTNGNADRMVIRWCSLEDLNDWALTDSNTAGETRLDRGSRMVTAIQSRSGILCWSDNQIYSVTPLSASDYDFVPKGTCSIASQNAAVDVNGMVYFMGTDGFYVYDGVLNKLECEVFEHVFNDINRDQMEKIYCSSYRFKKEVRWEYQSTDGTDCDRYVVFNYELNCWYFGHMTRTAYKEPAEAADSTKTYPYAAWNGYLYLQEVGTDEVEGATTNPMDWFLETADMLLRGNEETVISNFVMGDSQQAINSRLLGSDTNILANQFVPDFITLTVGMNVTMSAKQRPHDQNYQVTGPYYVDATDRDVNCRTKGSQIQFKFTPALDLDTGLVALGQSWRMGVWQLQGVIYGGR